MSRFYTEGKLMAEVESLDSFLNRKEPARMQQDVHVEDSVENKD